MITIEVVGLPELKRKLRPETVSRPVDAAMQPLLTRLSGQGNGLGARRNVITTQRQTMGARISTTRNWPRTTGESWQKRLEREFPAAAQAELDAAGKRIEAEWSK